MKLVLIFLFLSSSAFARDYEKPCKEGQPREIQLTKYRAAVVTDRLIRNVRENLNRRDISLNLRRKLHVAGNVLHCARRKLATLRWVCGHIDGDFVAKTWPIISRDVYLADSFFTDTRERQIATFIHEASHQCGTNDALYFNGDQPRDAGWRGWQSIADTYGYWAEHGFCIPGYCR